MAENEVEQETASTPKDENFERWETGISMPHWLTTGKPKAAKFFPDKEPQAWLDVLLKGGIKVPKEGDPTTVLIKGPPGSGKTTFATELCYRLAVGKPTQKKVTSAYISLESGSKQIVHNAKKFGWHDHIHAARPGTPGFVDIQEGVNVCGNELAVDWLKRDNVTAPDDVIVRWGIISKFLHAVYSNSPGNPPGIECRDTPTEKRPKVVVIDSLNIFSKEFKKDIFLDFMEAAKGHDANDEKVQLLVFILDTQPGESGDIPFWEYLCDTVIELGHHVKDGSFRRTIEIVKSRFQSNISGRHRFEILPESQKDDKPALPGIHLADGEGGIFILPSIHYYLSKPPQDGQQGSKSDGQQTSKPNDHHANKSDNQLGDESDGQPDHLLFNHTYPDNLSTLLSIDGKRDGGFPKGKCTALIGPRGGHKSHWGFLHLLARLTGSTKETDSEGKVVGKTDHDNEAALVISLQQDEQATNRILNRIWDHEQLKPMNGIRTVEEAFINHPSPKLKILHYPPGLTTPSEFIHRMLLHIHKLRQGEGGAQRNVTVLFNSLDQLKTWLPLCEEFDMFIPSIIEILKALDVTSIFVAMDDEKISVEPYGLLPASDLVLSFRKHEVTKEQNEILGTYKRRLPFIIEELFKKHYPNETKGQKIFQQLKDAKLVDTDVKFLDKLPIAKVPTEEVILKIDRFSGGHVKGAGGQGILELEGGRMRFTPAPADMHFKRVSED